MRNLVKATNGPLDSFSKEKESPKNTKTLTVKKKIYLNEKGLEINKPKFRIKEILYPQKPSLEIYH